MATTPGEGDAEMPEVAGPGERIGRLGLSAELMWWVVWQERGTMRAVSQPGRRAVLADARRAGCLAVVGETDGRLRVLAPARAWRAYCRDHPEWRWARWRAFWDRVLPPPEALPPEEGAVPLGDWSIFEADVWRGGVCTFFDAGVSGMCGQRSQRSQLVAVRADARAVWIETVYGGYVVPEDAAPPDLLPDGSVLVSSATGEAWHLVPRPADGDF